MTSTRDAQELETQSATLIELGEPESWLETMLRASRRQALHEASLGRVALAERWRKLTQALDHASAAMATNANPMQAGEPGESATQSQGET
jgi:hypothetical protein